MSKSKENPKVSIIVPIYNVEKYLDRCMSTLVNQTLIDIEIIMVDDGSPDNCPQMCDEWAKKDSRIKVIHKKNEGLGFARNAGLDVAIGEYVAFVDSDDFTEKDAYKCLYETAKKRDADVVYAGYHWQNTEGKESVFFVLDKEWNGREIVRFLGDMMFDDNPPEKNICMSMWNAIYRRDILEKNNVRFQSEREILSEDIVFHTQFLPLCKKIVCVPKAFYHYCYNGESLTHTDFKVAKIEASQKLYETLSDLIEKYKLLELRSSVSLLFENYVRGITLKGILLSSMSFKDKYKYCNKVYNYCGWNKVFAPLKNKKIPKKEAFGVFLIKHKAFLLNYLFFIFWYKILGKSKFDNI
ncbi:glycosyltransferase [Segatella bryantii]|uniref:glycosyltransferase n=1 Tax=Segatella bryantii TaxID=77095 RepID=UPI001EDAA222|nr:glycosyltransferase [Segatella bryantii]UKK74845.1 glycosyltransferase [Segatella bryantii]